MALKQLPATVAGTAKDEKTGEIKFARWRESNKLSPKSPNFFDSL